MGDNHVDGLYLLVIPFMLLPLIILFITVKYLIVRKRLARSIVRKSTFYQTLLPICAGIVAMGAGSNGALVLSSLTFLVAVGYVIWESYAIYNDAKVGGGYWKS